VFAFLPQKLFLSKKYKFTTVLMRMEIIKLTENNTAAAIKELI